MSSSKHSSSVIDFISKVDLTITEWVRDNISKNKNPFISNASFYLGLLPYELYVLPGMFVAMFVMFYEKSFHPIQFHLLPHWFAFSMARYIKNNFYRIRPGCIEEVGFSKMINSKHCAEETKTQSFPSGHTNIAVTLATTLRMYLMDETNRDTDKIFLGIPFYDPLVKNITIYFGFLVAFMISIHRISHGYHYFSDVLVGAILGYATGYAIYTITNRFKNCNTEENKDDTTWRVVQGVGMVVSFLAVFHFFVYKFHKLSTIQH